MVRPRPRSTAQSRSKWCGQQRTGGAFSFFPARCFCTPTSAALALAVPGGEHLQRVADLVERVARAKRQHMIGHGVGQGIVELAGREIARGDMAAEPGSHLGFGAAIEWQRMRMLVEECQRQIGDAQSEPRTVRQRMRGEAAERIVPAEIGVTVVRLRRHIGPRRPRQPLRGVMRLQPRGVQEDEIGAGNVFPGRSRHGEFPTLAIARIAMANSNNSRARLGNTAHHLADRFSPSTRRSGTTRMLRQTSVNPEMSSSRAAIWDTSIILPLMKGPRSVIRTTAIRPFS